VAKNNMGKLTSFTFLSLDGYYKGADEDISWHQHGQEEGKWSADNLKAENILLFGRKTYQHMASFWPTPLAAQLFPEVATGMNKAEKIVFSTTLIRADWNNTRVIRNNLVNEVRNLKDSSNKDMTILGSGEIVSQLAAAGMIDAFNFMIDPVAIGKGTPLFQRITTHLAVKLTGIRTFTSGVVLIQYEPLANVQTLRERNGQGVTESLG
jgi:dihydrofolate reductase